MLSVQFEIAIYEFIILSELYQIPIRSTRYRKHTKNPVP